MIKIGIIGLGKLGTALLNEIKNRPNEFTIASIFSKRTDMENTTTNIEDFCNKCDVLIDCSSQNFDSIASKINKPIVIASTQEIANYPTNVPILQLPNASCWPIIHKTLIELAKYDDYHFFIHDIHGAHKKDSPSGSIRKLLQELTPLNTSTEVVSSRKFDIKGSYDITVFNEIERIKISHEVLDRSAYAKGLLTAAKWIKNQEPGMYKTQDLYQ